MNTYVVSAAPSATDNICKAVLAFDNAMVSSVVSPASEDSNYPIELAYDFKTNTEYSPFISSGSVVIDITQSNPNEINYFALFSKNARDCNLSFTYQVMDIATGSYVTVGSRGSFDNAIPQMIYFDSIISIAQRLTIYFDSKCYIASLATGAAIVFSRTVSQGYQPARNASIDEVSNFSTDGNNFVQGRRIVNGYQEKAPINYQNYAFIDTWWRRFMNHVLDSKPLYFMANNQHPLNCVFGLQNPSSMPKPSYKNSDETDLDFDINGWA